MSNLSSQKKSSYFAYNNIGKPIFLFRKPKNQKFNQKTHKHQLPLINNTLNPFRQPSETSNNSWKTIKANGGKGDKRWEKSNSNEIPNIFTIKCDETDSSSKYNTIYNNNTDFKAKFEQSPRL